MKTLTQIVKDAGMRPVDLASKARLSLATVERAMKGNIPNPVGCWAMALALGVNEDEIRESIKAARFTPPESQKEATDE